MKTFTAYAEWDPTTKLYIGIVPELPGVHTQAASLDELEKNLKKEVIGLYLEEPDSEQQQVKLSVCLSRLPLLISSVAPSKCVVKKPRQASSIDAAGSF